MFKILHVEVSFESFDIRSLDTDKVILLRSTKYKTVKFELSRNAFQVEADLLPERDKTQAALFHPSN